jgi:hypothetical protein
MSIYIYTNDIFSATRALRLAISGALLFTSLCLWPDKFILAQTAVKDQVEEKDSGSDQSQPVDNKDKTDAGAIIRQVPESASPPAESAPGSSGKAEDLGGKMDRVHSNLFNIAQGQVERVDKWFRSSEDQQTHIKPSQFRLDVFGDAKKLADDGFNLKPEISLDANIELPDVVRHLKLMVTTIDPTALPGRDINNQQNRSIRTAFSKQWMSDITTAIGVRARWKTPLFAYAAWSPVWKRGAWQLYPQEKFYWQNRDGIGEISTLIFDHWTGRWNTRTSTSVKWSKQDFDADRGIGRNDHGFRWSEVFIFDHANELLDETQLGRMVSGDDIMRGWGVRLSAFGGFHFVDEYQTGLGFRWPLLKKWMYFFTQPELDWKRVDNWKPRWTIKFGLDMLFWGGGER